MLFARPGERCRARVIEIIKFYVCCVSKNVSRYAELNYKFFTRRKYKEEDEKISKIKKEI